MKKTILKKEDWGLLTITSLLATFVFPPYFIHLMTMAALTEFAHLWTTRLNRKDQETFIQFEKEFRKGYKLEKEDRVPEALALYRQLVQKYAALPQASKLAELQIEKLGGERAVAASKPRRPRKAKP